MGIRDRINKRRVVRLLPSHIQRDVLRTIVDLVKQHGGTLEIPFNAVTEDIDIAAGKDCMDVNFWGVVRCVKAFGPAMRSQRSGHIVNISSIAGTMGLIAQPVYVGSKFALEGMSECLAQEMAPYGVRVSVIEPGVTRTP